MALVNENECIILLSKPFNVWQRTNIAIHGEHAISDNESAAAILTLRKHPLQVSHVLVLVAILL